MSLAVPPYETRVSKFLAERKQPATALEILTFLKRKFRMKTLRLPDINSVLYNSSAYESVSESTPARWTIRKQTLFRATKTSQFSDLGDIPPLEVAASGEFRNKTAVIGGETGSRKDILAALELLRAKGATFFCCLTGQAAGKLAKTITSEKNWRCEEISYSGADVPRLGLALAHRLALDTGGKNKHKKPPVACLCLVGPQKTEACEIHHLVGYFESRDVPVFLARGPD